MFDWLTSLWNTDGFVPRKECGTWTPGWITLHTFSDILIWLAYLSIPLVLLVVARHQALKRFRPLLWLFAAFILSCGMTHLIEAIIFERPIYRLSGVLKAVTAVVSWATVFALVPSLGGVLGLLDKVDQQASSPAAPESPTGPPHGGRNPVVTYSLAVFIGLLAVSVRFALQPVLGDLPALGINLLAVIFISWYGGFLPGLVTLVLTSALSASLFIFPRQGVDADALNRQVDFGMYLVAGLGALLLGELQRRTRRQLYAKMAQLQAATTALTAEKQATERAAARLRESEGRFRQLADSMPQIVFAARPDGHVDYFNHRWYEFTGFAPDSPTGIEKWREVHRPEAFDRVREAWERAVRAGEPYQIEYQLKRADGEWRWHLGRAVPVRDETGNVVRWYGTNTDIDDRKRLELDLEDARRFNESVLHSLPGHLAVLENDGRIVKVNESWRQFGMANGTPADFDWTTTNYYTACEQHPLGERVVAGIKAVARGERAAFELEYPCHGGGVERFFLLRVNRFRGEGPVRMVVTHENITERVVAERQVREAVSQLGQLTEGVPLLMWACRATGECDYLSRQWLEYTGRGLAEQLGSGWLDAVHPDDREATRVAWQQAVEGRAEYDLEYRIRRHDGVYRWFAVRGIPLRDQNGLVVRWFGSCTDVDDRVQQEEILARLVEERTLALQEQKIFLNTILDNVAEGIVACDADGKLQLFNAASRRIHGLSEEFLTPDRWVSHYQLFEPDGVTPMPTEQVPLFRAWRGERVRDAEIVVRAPGQPERYLSCTGQQLRGQDGTVFGAVVSMRDITERRERERELIRTSEALRESNQELEKFAYIASHDLQEPLRKIQAFGTRLADKFGDSVGEQGKDYIARMLDSAGRMRRLIEDLLAFSRVTTKAAALTPVDLDAVVRDVLSDLEERISESAAQVEVSPLPTVSGDPSQLRQVFQNLISNALKFARPDVPPVVRVTAEQSSAGGTAWRITVADNGIGFDPKYADRIFELFQRLHGRGVYEGTGLGLAIVRKILQRHGANIAAHSRPGHGTEFVIDWPPLSDTDALSVLPTSGG